MANPFKAAIDKAEAHPAIAAMIFGTIILIVTLIVTKRNAVNSTTPQVQPTIDPNTGLPLTNNGSYTLTPTNNNSDVLSAIGNLSQAFQNFVASNNQVANNTNNSGGTNTGGTTNTGTGTGNVAAPPPQPPTSIIDWIKDHLPPTVNNPPVAFIGPPTPAPQTLPRPIPVLQQVTVAKWTATNTPWNSTLSGIASHYGESLAYIESVNPQITNPNLIYPGQKVNY